MKDEQIEALIDRLKIQWIQGRDDLFHVDGKRWPRTAVEQLIRQEAPEPGVAIKARVGEALSEMTRILLWVRCHRVFETPRPGDTIEGFLERVLGDRTDEFLKWVRRRLLEIGIGGMRAEAPFIPVGEQLMQLKPAQRRCPICLGQLTYQGGCGGRKVPICEPCGTSFPRGAASPDMIVILDGKTGVVNGWF